MAFRLYKLLKTLALTILLNVFKILMNSIIVIIKTNFIVKKIIKPQDIRLKITKLLINKKINFFQIFMIHLN